MNRLAVIGHPVAHSRSPAIHAAFAAACGDDVDYQRLPAPLDGFLATAQAFAREGARGCNVTVPFKQEAFAACTQLSARARLAQAVNTIRFDDGDGWYGDNTDGAGLLRDIVHNAGVPLAGARVLLVGAGGAAAGSLGPILDAGPAAVVVVNRTRPRAEALVARFAEATGSGLASCPRASDHQGHASRGQEARPDPSLHAADVAHPGPAFDIVINATAASLAGDLPPLPPGTVRPGGLALDMMYGAAARPFLRWAATQGATGRDGVGMLVEQAAEAYALWFGHRPPTRDVLATLRREMDAA